MLGGEVVVAEIGPGGVGRFEDLERLGGELDLLGGAVHLGALREGLVHPVPERLGCDAEPLEDRQDHAFGLSEERREEMLRRDLLMVALAGQRLGGLERLAGLLGELVGV